MRASSRRRIAHLKNKVELSFMSKSKSRQPSKQASLADVKDAKGTVKLAEDASPDTKDKQTTSASKQAPVAKPIATVHRPTTRDGAKYERRQAERQSRYMAQRRAKRVRNTIITVVALVVVLGGSLTAYFVYNAQHTARAAGPTPFTPFTEAIFDSDFQPVDNVYCDQLEQSVEHIHAHLSIYIDGSPVTLPANIGIPANQQSQQATCFYWLHVHDTSGVIHIESPSAEPFMLGQFLDEWNQQFNSLGFPQQLLLSSGWTIWVNGKAYHGSLTSVPLNAHDLITIAYNSPNAKPDTTYAWPSNE
jgi:hypothetical protein